MCSIFSSVALVKSLLPGRFFRRLQAEIHSPTTHPSIHRSNHPPTHLSIHPLIHPIIHPCNQPFPHSSRFTHSFVRLFIHLFIHPSINSCIHRFIHYSTSHFLIRPRSRPIPLVPFAGVAGFSAEGARGCTGLQPGSLPAGRGLQESCAALHQYE